MLSFPYAPVRPRASNRRMFSAEEDARLLGLVGDCRAPLWADIARAMGDRTARQCRERWCNYLNPDIRTEPWTEDEDSCLIEKVNELGHVWVAMSSFFNRRSESDVKNRWYSHLKAQCGRDPFSGKWARMIGPREDQGKERAKRQRANPCPSQAAQQLLERAQKPPPPVSDSPFVKSPSETFDYWDNSLCEQVLEEGSGMESWLASRSEP